MFAFRRIYSLGYKSAKKIQSAWRGYSARRRFPRLRCELQRERAATCIQRAVRQWLYFRAAAAAEPEDPGDWRLTPEGVARLEEEVARWQEELDSSQLPSAEELRRVSREVRLGLARFHARLRANRWRLRSLRRRARLLQEVCAALAAPPDLQDISDVDLSFFRRVPRQAAEYARLRHRFSVLMLDQACDAELPGTPVGDGDPADDTATPQQ